MNSVGFVAAALCGVALFGLSAADSDTGQHIFERRCSGCHALDIDKEGPRLRTVFGRRVASSPGFGYSDSLKKVSGPWDTATLDAWLSDPEKVAPGNDMAFRLANAGERKAVIEWLQSLSATKNEAGPRDAVRLSR